MNVQKVFWLALIGAIMVAGNPVKYRDVSSENDRGLNYEEYVRQLEKKHKIAYNDIDQPWTPISDDSQDSDEFVLSQDDFTSARPHVSDSQITSQAPDVPVATTEEKKLADSVGESDWSKLSTEKVLTSSQPSVSIEEETQSPATESNTVTNLVEKSVIKVDQSDDGDAVNEGSGQALVPSIDNDEGSGVVDSLAVSIGNDQGSGMADPLAASFSDDEGSGLDQSLVVSNSNDEVSGVADSLTTLLSDDTIAVEGSGSSVTESTDFRADYPTTIQPEPSTNVATTETERVLATEVVHLLLKNDLPLTDQPETTTLESDSESTTIETKSLQENNVVEGLSVTDSPIESTEQTEIQPSPTGKIADGDDSTVTLTDETTLPTSNFKQDTISNDSVEPVESITLPGGWVAVDDSTVIVESTTVELVQPSTDEN